jgi:hypothetical protein
MKVYKITSSKIEGWILLTYLDGYLTGIQIDVKGCLNDAQYKMLWQLIRSREDELLSEGMGNLDVKVEKTNEKIALFCGYYKQYLKVNYRASGIDGGKLKGFVVSDGLLKTYFTSNNFLFKGKHSVNNFVKYYNELRQEASGETATRHTHPNYYDGDYEKKLSNAQALQTYWKHLINLGWKREQRGTLTFWKEPAANINNGQGLNTNTGKEQKDQK